MAETYKVQYCLHCGKCPQIMNRDGLFSVECSCGMRSVGTFSARLTCSIWNAIYDFQPIEDAAPNNLPKEHP